MKKVENLASFVFMFVGGFFLIISIFMIPQIFNYEGKIDTTGIITDINRISHPGDDDTHEVFVSYQVNGVDYESKLNTYSSTYHVGKEIDIYYDEDNPESIGTKGGDLIFLLFPVLGGIAFVVGISTFIRSKKQKKIMAKLKETGMIVNAKYVETRINHSYSVNGRNPYKIVCEWFSSEDNMTYQFISENIWDDPSQYIIDNNITSFPVYINPQNKKQYVIDYKAMLPNIQ